MLYNSQNRDNGAVRLTLLLFMQCGRLVLIAPSTGNTENMWKPGEADMPARRLNCGVGSWNARLHRYAVHSQLAVGIRSGEHVIIMIYFLRCPMLYGTIQDVAPKS